MPSEPGRFRAEPVAESEGVFADVHPSCRDEVAARRRADGGRERSGERGEAARPWRRGRAVNTSVHARAHRHRQWRL